ncbi:MAG: DUF2993 domain-containing protein [Halothece sp.]
MTNIGEEALSKAAEIGLSSQLDEAEELNVDVEANPGELVQGKVDSVEIEGEGLVMEKDLRTEELELKTDAIAINPLKAAFGEIELQQPTKASAYVVLKEQDIERAFNSEYIQNKLQNLKVTVNDKPITLKINSIKFHLPGNNKVSLMANVLLVEPEETKEIAFSAICAIAANGYSVSLKEIEFAKGKEASPELTEALLESTKELLDLRNFELEGMSLRLTHLDMQKGKLTLQAQAQVEEFPNG